MAKTKKVKAEKSKKPSYLKEVKDEMKKVSFPSVKEVTTYTIATIVIVALLIAFFLLLTALLSWVKGAF